MSFKLHYPKNYAVSQFEKLYLLNYADEQVFPEGILPNLPFATNRLHFSLGEYMEIREIYENSTLYEETDPNEHSLTGILDYINITIDQFIYELGHYPIILGIAVVEALQLALNFSVQPADYYTQLSNFILRYQLDIEMDDNLLAYPPYELYFLLTRGYCRPYSPTQYSFMMLRATYPDYSRLIDAVYRDANEQNYEICQESIMKIKELGAKQFGLQYLGTNNPYHLFMNEYLKFMKIEKGKLIPHRLTNLSKKINLSVEEMEQQMLDLTDVEIEMLASPRQLPNLAEFRSRRMWINTIRVMLSNPIIYKQEKKYQIPLQKKIEYERLKEIKQGIVQYEEIPTIYEVGLNFQIKLYAIYESVIDSVLVHIIEKINIKNVSELQALQGDAFYAVDNIVSFMNKKYHFHDEVYNDHEFSEMLKEYGLTVYKIKVLENNF